MKNDLKTVIYGRIEKILAAEKITRAEMADVSREMLEYVPDTDDIDCVNRLIMGLTPMNRKLAIMFFDHFLPWDAERDTEKQFLRFGKRTKGERKIKEKMELITAFLADKTANIWTWGDDNVEIKKKDFAAAIEKAIKRALKGDTKSDTAPLTHAQVVDAVLDSGISVVDLLNAVTPFMEKVQQAKGTIDAAKAGQPEAVEA